MRDYQINPPRKELESLARILKKSKETFDGPDAATFREAQGEYKKHPNQDELVQKLGEKFAELKPHMCSGVEMFLNRVPDGISGYEILLGTFSVTDDKIQFINRSGGDCNLVIRANDDRDDTNYSRTYLFMLGKNKVVVEQRVSGPSFFWSGYEVRGQNVEEWGLEKTIQTYYSPLPPPTPSCFDRINAFLKCKK